MKHRLPSLILCLCVSSAVFATGEMRAVVFSGGQLQIEQVPKPEPQADQVRIKVRAASVNPVDWKQTSRAEAGSRTIPGRDLSGIIDAVGGTGGPWRVGQAVMGVTKGGAYADYALVSINALARKPQRLSFDEAAGLPVVGETAWRALVTIANVQRGQRVLIQGGAGGVGSLAVQIAKDRGAYVIATASPNHDQLLRSLGADEVLDYHTVRFEEKVKEIDVVFNTVNAETGARSIAVLKPGGILVSVNGAAPTEQCATARVRCATTGFVTGESLGTLAELAQQGKLRVHIERVFPLAQAAEALELSRQGHVGGKIILEVGSPVF